MRWQWIGIIASYRNLKTLFGLITFGGLGEGELCGDSVAGGSCQIARARGMATGERQRINTSATFKKPLVIPQTIPAFVS